MASTITRIGSHTSLENLLRSAPGPPSVLLPVGTFTLPLDLKPKVPTLDPQQIPGLVDLFDKMKKEPALKGFQVLVVMGALADIPLQYTARTTQGKFVTALRCSKDLAVILDGVATALAATGHPLAGVQATADALGLLVKTVDGVYEILRVSREGTG